MISEPPAGMCVLSGKQSGRPSASFVHYAHPPGGGAGRVASTCEWHSLLFWGHAERVVQLHWGVRLRLFPWLFAGYTTPVYVFVVLCVCIWVMPYPLARSPELAQYMWFLLLLLQPDHLDRLLLL